MKSVLSRCNLLKKFREEYFRKLYVAPDRAPEERKEHHKLVSKKKGGLSVNQRGITT